jgi:cell shape-determining protein MreC
MSRTEIYLKEQAELREKQLADQVKKMEDENKKLKDKFQFNSHLNRIQAMSSNVKIRF